jgi:Fe-S oxidoreductase
MSKTSKASVPPGLLFISENIKSKQNIIGAPKAEKAKWAKGIEFSDKKDTIFFAGCGYQYSSALESMMSLIKKTEKSVFGADMAMGFASSFQKKLGINAGDMYRKVMTRESEDEAQPLKDAVKALKKLGIEFGYLAEEEPCCGGLLYYSGLREDFAKNAEETFKKLKSFGVKKIISIVPSCTYSLKTL